jgi:hypothetical protein
LAIVTDTPLNKSKSPKERLMFSAERTDIITS